MNIALVYPVPGGPSLRTHPTAALQRAWDGRGHYPVSASPGTSMSRAPSLRSTLVALTALLTVLAVLVAGALVVLTSALGQATVSIGAAVESVRLAEEAQIGLLIHDRSRDAVVRRDREGAVRRRIAEAGQYVTTEDEARVLEEVRVRVDAYLVGSRDPAVSGAEMEVLQAAAYGALDALVALNLSQAREAQARARSWDALANGLGLAVGLPVLLVGGGLVWWLRAVALAPVLSLARTMERFGQGDRSARARETGPAELRHMSQRFNEMAAALAAQRQAQLAFLGGVAHDLRNPLSALRMSLATVRPDRPLPAEPRLRRTLEMVGRQIVRLERMVDDFLDMAMIEAGELHLTLEPHDARELVQDVVDLLEGSAPGHRLDVRFPSGPIPLRCDGMRIEQVLLNLVGNAIKYSPAGTVVAITAEKDGAGAVLRVSDQGIGISVEDQRRLFAPFRRVGPAGQFVPGAGLGLFVVRRIVEAHGGRVEVESRLGQGSCFSVHLPAASAPLMAM